LNIFAVAFDRGDLQQLCEFNATQPPSIVCAPAHAMLTFAHRAKRQSNGIVCARTHTD
jgi:hypothetical protein